MARLGDYVNIKTGKLDANASSENGAYPFFTCSVIPLKIDTYSYDCECVLVAGNGDLNVKYYNGKFDAYQRTYIIESKDKTVLLVPYVYCFLDKYVETLRKQSIGGVIKYIKLGNLTDAPIPIYDIQKQKEIVSKLDFVESLITARREQLAKLDELVKSRFIELFGAGKYPIVKAADVCDFITKGTTPPTGEITEKYEIGLIPYLKVYNLSFTGELLFDSMPQYIPVETHNKQLARSKVVPNDVLMNIVGPPLGKFSLVTDEFSEWNINQAIAIFRAKDRVLPRYLLAALMQPEVLRPFLEQAVGIRQLNLSLEQCRNLEFPLPPIEEQKAFVSFSEQTDKSKLAIQQSLDKLELLKKSLMQKYFG